ncbi:MAG: aminotransferase class I/II-fold pyridoxal phosphate-dependent enzyme [Candidatus Glassbacteria bacterium]
MIPLTVPNLSGNEGKYLQECISSTFVSSVGPFVNRFELMAAEATGAKYAVAASAGTTALHLALVALGVGRDDLVILPSFTFIASANAIAHCGAEPWLFDVDPESWTLDTDLLEDALASRTHTLNGSLVHTETNRRVAAIMPVYTLGATAKMDAVKKIARRYRLPVVADAAAAIGARYRGKPLAGLADLTVISFNGNKTITSGGGGMVVGNNGKLLELVRHLSTQARAGREYNHDRRGFNYRMTNLQAAVGCAQMEQMEKFIEAKRHIRRTYDEAFAEFPGIKLFPKPDWCESTCWFSGIVIQDSTLPGLKKVIDLLGKEGIEARTFWKPVHLQPPYSNTPRATLTFSENIWSKILTLPCSTGLTCKEQDYIIQKLTEILRKIPRNRKYMP